MNEDALPEDSANVCPAKKHQVREDEHGGGDGAEKADAAPLHRSGDILLLGNQQIKNSERQRAAKHLALMNCGHKPEGITQSAVTLYYYFENMSLLPKYTE